MNLNAQDYLAKLLAKENLTVQHGNYSTASFNVEDRILQLPLWADKGKAVYDLLVGHEVGHALYTPADGWHDSEKEIPGVPRAYINIIEDIRIEKKIQRTYPGIVRSFTKGYKRLFDDNIFGTEDRDMTKASFMDRLNIYSKGRGYFDVAFTDTEQMFADLAMAVESWEDVLNACKEINDFVKNEEDYNDDDPETTSPTGDQSNEDGQEMETSDGNGEASDETQDGDGEGVGEGENPGDTLESQSDTLTDEAQRENEDKLLDTEDDGSQNVYSSGLSDVSMESMLVSYQELKAERATARYPESSYNSPEVIEEFDNFMKNSKATVNLMVKDFERKKAAWEYSRSSEAKKGSLNVNKLHQYQYSEDIFLTVQQLATAQSHGIIMVIDQSGSMQYIMQDVTKQVMTIALFCRRVNIPFEAYTYTTGHNTRGFVEERNDTTTNFFRGRDIKMVNVFNSKLKKKEFMEAMKNQLAVALSVTYGNSVMYSDTCKYDKFGTTPTVQAIMLTKKIIDRFTPVQNINVMVLTDGIADSVQVENAYRSSAKGEVTTNNNITFKFGNKLVHGNYSDEVVENTIKALKQMTGAKVTGFFISDSSKQSFYQGYCQFAQKDYVGDAYNKDLKTWKKDKVLALKNVCGFNDFFLARVDDKNPQAEFEIKDNKNGKATAIKDVRSQFRKFNKNKKAGKVLVNKITDAIAVAA